MKLTFLLGILFLSNIILAQDDCGHIITSDNCNYVGNVVTFSPDFVLGNVNIGADESDYEIILRASVLQVRFKRKGTYIITFGHSCGKSHSDQEINTTIEKEITIIDNPLKDIKFDYGILNAKTYSGICTFKPSSSFKVMNGKHLLSNLPSSNQKHSFTLKKNGQIISNETAQYNSIDLSNLEIYESGNYSLEHRFAIKCSGNISEQVNIVNFKVQIKAPTLNENIFDHLINNYSCDNKFDGSGLFNIPHKEYLNAAQFKLYKKVNGTYREVRYPVDNSLNTKIDKSDLSTFIIESSGEYKLYYNLKYCSKNLLAEGNIIINLSSRTDAFASNDCKSCQEGDTNYFCEDANKSKANSGEFGNQLGETILYYTKSCKIEATGDGMQSFNMTNATLFPSAQTKKKFLNVSVLDQLSFILELDETNDNLQSIDYNNFYLENINKERYTKINRNTITTGINNRNKHFVKFDVDFRDDFFNSGGIFHLKTKVHIVEDSWLPFFSTGGTRDVSVYLCVFTLEEPVLKKTQQNTICQGDNLFIDVDYKYNLEYFIYESDPSCVFDNTCKAPLPIKNGNGKVNSIIRDFGGNYWFEYRSYDNYTSKGNVKKKKSSEKYKVVHSITVIPKAPKPINGNHFIELNINTKAKILDFLDDEGLAFKEFQVAYIDIFGNHFDDNGEILDSEKNYQSINNNTQITLESNSSIKRLLIRRVIERKNGELVYSAPTKLVFLPKPQIQKTIICPYKFKFENSNRVILDDAIINYEWTTKKNNNLLGSSNSEALIYDYNKDSGGSNQRFTVDLKVTYIPKSNFYPPKISRKQSCLNDSHLKNQKMSAVPLNLVAPANFKLNTVETNFEYYNMGTGLSTSAMSYSDAWFLESNNNKVQRQLFNSSPWFNGQSGIWRMDKQFAYITNRNSSQKRGFVNIQDEGLMTLSTMSWSTNAELNELSGLISDENEKWVQSSKINKYNERGFLSEEEDAIGNNSGILFTENGQFVKASGANMKRSEMLYTSFEEESDLIKKHIKYKKIKVISGKGLLGIIDSNIKDIDKILTDDETVVVVRGIEFNSDLPSPFLLKGLISCKFEYSYKGSQNHETINKAKSNDFTLVGIDGFGFNNLSDWVGEIIVPISEDENILTISEQEAHTGRNSLNFSSSTIIKLNHLSLKSNQKYTFCSWVKIPTLENKVVNYTNDIEVLIGNNTLEPTGLIINGWQRVIGTFSYNDKLPLSLTLNSINGKQIFLDDIRIYPENGSMKSYYYDPTNYRLMSTLDENNFATYFSYDDEGNLELLKKETEKGIVTIQEVHQSINQ